MNISSSYVVPLVGFGEQRSFVLLYNILIHLYKRKMALFLKKDRRDAMRIFWKPLWKAKKLRRPTHILLYKD